VHTASTALRKRSSQERGAPKKEELPGKRNSQERGTPEEEELPRKRNSKERGSPKKKELPRKRSSQERGAPKEDFNQVFLRKCSLEPQRKTSFKFLQLP